MLTVLVAIFSVITGALVAYHFKYTGDKKRPEKILNVYSQPGKWYYLKYLIFLGILLARKLIRELSKNHWLAKKIFPKGKSITELEKLQQLSTHDQAFDAVFFQAVSQDGIYLCGGTERRHGAKVNGLFYIAVPKYGLLLSEKLPKTLLDTDPDTLLFVKTYSAEGICFTPVIPMEKWKVSYKGKMRFQNDPDKLVDVKLNTIWTSDLPYFMFDEDMNCSTVARALARERWNKQFFQSLKEAHQSHYEQMGFLKGTLTVDGKDFQLNLDAFRDHSFGYKRDWSLMHRYIFHMLYLENGTRVIIGVVSQPCTTSHLEMGYILHPNKSIEAIESCDLLLYQHGENGTPPKSIGFSFTANGITYETFAEVEHEAVHFLGNEDEARMVERFIKCKVNDVRGRGLSEWHYNNVK